MTIVPLLTTDVPIDLCSALPTYGLLYWYARALDVSGRGIVSIDWQSAALALGKSQATIARYAREGVKGGLFYRALPTASGHKLRLKSLVNVAMEKGFTTLNAFVAVGLDDMHRVKTIAVEAGAHQLQRQSLWLKCKRHKALVRKGIETSVPALTELLLAQDSDCPPRTEPGETGNPQERQSGQRRYYYHNSSDSLFWGATQAQIAKALGISAKTVQRKLSANHRTSLGLKAIDRRQQLVPTGLTASAVRFAESEEIEVYSTPAVQLDPSALLVVNHLEGEAKLLRTGKRVPLLIQSGIVYRFRPNVYAESTLTFKRKRHLRKALKALI